MNFRKILSVLVLLLISLSLFSCKIVLPGTNGDKELHELIEQEYNDLSNYKKTEHTKWTFNACIIDMSSTTYNENYNSYEIRMILD